MFAFPGSLKEQNRWCGSFLRERLARARGWDAQGQFSLQQRFTVENPYATDRAEMTAPAAATGLRGDGPGEGRRRRSRRVDTRATQSL